MWTGDCKYGKLYAMIGVRRGVREEVRGEVKGEVRGEVRGAKYMFLCIHKTDYAYRKVTKYQKYIFFCIKQTLKNWPQMTPGSQTPT